VPAFRIRSPHCAGVSKLEESHFFTPFA
jgi:hypothetical protein